MNAAAWPRSELLAERLLWIDPAAGTQADGGIADLPSLVGPGDLLVVNDAATLPASLHGVVGGRDGEPIENPNGPPKGPSSRGWRLAQVSSAFGTPSETARRAYAPIRAATAAGRAVFT